MNEDDLIKKGALGWWKETISSESESKNSKRDRAELRRCHSTTDVILVPSFYTFVDKTNVKINNYDKNGSELLHQLAAIAWVLSWVDEDEIKIDEDGNKVKFAEILAVNPVTEKPLLSKMRFRRLLASDDWDELSVQLIRALKMTKGRANVSDLIDSIRFWKRGTTKYGTTKESWAISYYGSIKDKKMNKETKL